MRRRTPLLSLLPSSFSAHSSPFYFLSFFFLLSPFFFFPFFAALLPSLSSRSDESVPLHAGEPHPPRERDWARHARGQSWTRFFLISSPLSAALESQNDIHVDLDLSLVAVLRVRHVHPLSRYAADLLVGVAGRLLQFATRDLEESPQRDDRLGQAVVGVPID